MHQETTSSTTLSSISFPSDRHNTKFATNSSAKQKKSAYVRKQATSVTAEFAFLTSCHMINRQLCCLMLGVKLKAAKEYRLE